MDDLRISVYNEPDNDITLEVKRLVKNNKAVILSYDSTEKLRFRKDKLNSVLESIKNNTTIVQRNAEDKFVCLATYNNEDGNIIVKSIVVAKGEDVMSPMYSIAYWLSPNVKSISINVDVENINYVIHLMKTGFVFDLDEYEKNRECFIKGVLVVNKFSNIHSENEYVDIIRLVRLADNLEAHNKLLLEQLCFIIDEEVSSKVSDELLKIIDKL